MKFKYKKLPAGTNPSKPWILRPILQIRLSYGAKHENVRCLVDTGADDCLFHTSIADLLGIDVKAGTLKQFSGIAGGHPVDAYMHWVKFEVQGFSETIDALVGFVDSDSVYGILGQSGFFHNYCVTFEHYRARFEVSSRPKDRR